MYHSADLIFAIFCTFFGCMIVFAIFAWRMAVPRFKEEKEVETENDHRVHSLHILGSMKYKVYCRNDRDYELGPRLYYRQSKKSFYKTLLRLNFDGEVIEVRQADGNLVKVSKEEAPQAICEALGIEWCPVTKIVVGHWVRSLKKYTKGIY